jgi:tRNA (cytosine34-C5)-methyltransferase
MVYSTCSLNPIENEGVLHRLLCETGDSVCLIDCKHLVPGLLYNHGKILDFFNAIETKWKLE